jgi:NADH:ubiquinone reductase (H+-translocating)
MDEAIPLLRRVIEKGNRPGRAIDLIFKPWLLLATRVWLSQVAFVHRIMIMMAAAPGSGHAALFALVAAVEGIGPLLLAIGVLTRPVAVTLLAEAVLNPLGAEAAT